MVLLDLMGLPFLEEAQRFCSDRQISASSWKDPCHPPEFLKSQKDSCMSIREIVKSELAKAVVENSPVPFPEHLDDDAQLDEFWLDSIVFTTLLGPVDI